MSERCKQTSKRTSEWPSTYVSILVGSRPQCTVRWDDGCLPETEQWDTGIDVIVCVSIEILFMVPHISDQSWMAMVEKVSEKHF